MAAKVQFFDSVALAAVVSELNALGEARIDKVGQPSPYELYLNLRAGRRNVRLYINVRDAWARMHLTERQFPNLPVPFAFTMQLRKHLEGSRLLRVEQAGLERAATLVVAGRDELGDPFERHLVVELIGKYANMFLVDSQGEQVMGCLRAVTEEMCQARQLGPGLPYAGPPLPEGKVSFLAATEADFVAALASEGRVVDRLIGRVTGVSKVALMQILAGVGLAPQVAVDELEAIEPLLAGLHLAQQRLREGVFYPRLEAGPGWDYNLWWLGAGAPPESVGASAMLDRYYGRLEANFILEDRRRVLKSEINELLRKQRGRLAEWESGITKSESADRFRELGDLITSHMYLIQPGAAQVEVTDFYHPEQPSLALALDPQLTPSENAQRYFRKYQKARNSREALEGLLGGAREELAYLEQVATAIEQATELSELQEVAEELAVLTGKPIQKPRGPRQGAEPPPRPMVFTSSDGLPIYVGKNNKQNDYLTLKLAHNGDIWLHAQNIPGSHVVIRTDEAVPETTLHEAAELAAYYSQARGSNQVPVVYTQRRHVKKPRGAKPGMVIYEQEKTLFVNPGETAPELVQAGS